MKSAVEILVAGFINQEENEDDEMSVKLKKNQLTLPVLEAWYHEQYQHKTKPSLVVMIADFELFNSTCIQELITILSSYTDRLRFVLVLGVATAFKALHNVLPAHITNKLDSHVFQSDSSTSMLNKILDEAILTHKSPFQLSGKSFKILIDVFLFYDYSLNSFIQGYQLFMLEHFSTRHLSARLHKIDVDEVEKLNHEACETIRRTCMSFRTFVESVKDPQMRIDLIKDDMALKSRIVGRIRRVETYWYQFHWCLRVLAVLLEDLPRNELGKLTRELYPICVATNVTDQDEYKECLKLLRFSSKDKFLAKMDKIIEITESYIQEEMMKEEQKSNVKKIYLNFKTLREKIALAGMSPMKDKAMQTPKTPTTPSATVNKKGAMGRQEMMEKLKESAVNNQTRVLIDYEVQLNECLDYLNSKFRNYLRPISEAPPLNEFFVFTDSHSVRKQIVGAPRGALHNALSNPHLYLQCSCCALTENEQILPTLPDIAIGYKLHLENNKFINLYDWLQAFAMVIEPNDDEDEITPEVQ